MQAASLANATNFEETPHEELKWGDSSHLRTPAGFLQGIQKIALHGEFNYFMASVFPKAERRQLEDVLIVTNWPSSLFDLYAAGNIFGQSSIFRHAARSTCALDDPNTLFQNTPRHQASRFARQTFRAGGFKRTVGICPYDAWGRRYVVIFSGSVLPTEPGRDHARLLVEVSQLLEKHAAPLPSAQSIFQLSERETECLSWTAAGKSSREISDILQLSPHTINSYIKLAMKKLQVETRTQAVAKACRLGFI